MLRDHNPKTIPIVLFAYARPDHLRRTLDSLRANEVPLIYAFSDGPRTPDKAAAVAEIRKILGSIDWCEVNLCERQENLGLGRSILTGVTEAFTQYDTIIVFEDDLICVPGTYQYLCAALNHYRDDPRVMSVTGWTHPRVTPRDVVNQPYFDGRAECLVWGAWARSWQGMDRDALTLMRECQRQGIDVYRYGADLVEMAQAELERNIWAVRFLFLHILLGKLCLRPPHSMVEHIGFDSSATNSPDADGWSNPPLQPSPMIPTAWPVPVEHPDCVQLWQTAYGNRAAHRNLPRRVARRVRRTICNFLQKL